MGSYAVAATADLTTGGGAIIRPERAAAVENPIFDVVVAREHGTRTDESAPVSAYHSRVFYFFLLALAV